MAKSAEQIKQSAANKVQKNVQPSNTSFINIPSNANTANELAAEKAKAQALENKHIALANEKALLEGKHKNLNETHANLEKAHDTLANEKALLEEKHNDLNITYENLKKVHKDLKIKFSNDNKEIEQEDTTGITEDSSSDNKDKKDGGKLEFSNKIGYNLIAPIIEKIKAEFFLSDDKENKVKKCDATSISHKESHIKCFEKSAHSIKSIESEPDNCEKIYSLHTFLDSIGMEKDDINHAGFLSFVDNNNQSELENMVAPKFNDFINQYSYADEGGKKVIKYIDGQECFRMEKGEISTYGENSFSGKCAPLINLYMLLQIAKNEEIYHFNGYDLKDYDDTEFQNILALDFTDPDAAGAL